MRRLLIGSRLGLVFLLTLVPVGVAAAVVMRSSPTRPEASTKRAAAPRPRPQPVLSLDDIRRPASATEDAPTGAPRAKVENVIGVGTGRFDRSARTASANTAIEDVDGPPDPSEMKAPSDAEVRSELAAFRNHLDGLDPRDAGRWYIDGKGQAHIPRSVPKSVAMVVAAANEIAKTPYKWGGGHGAWKDSGYDCSGSVSFALAGARLLDHPLDSSGLMRYGSGGRGRWISIYANAGHVFMFVGPLRFDTSGATAAHTRWQTGGRPTGGYTVRHPTRF